MQVHKGKKETKKYLQNLLDSIVDPMIALDTKGSISFISEEALNVLGYESEEIIGKHVSICFKRGMEEANKIFTLLKQKGKLNNYEMLCFTKFQREIPSVLSASYIRDEEGTIVGALGIFREISERKRLENELKDPKDFLEIIIESSAVAIVTVNEKGKVTFVNAAAEAIMGCAKDVIGSHVSRFYQGGIEEARKVFSILKEKGNLENYETVLVGKNSKLIPISASISRLKDEKGQVEGTLGVLKDNTERKMFQEELERLSITDDLTGLYNQRHFYRELNKEIERAKRQNRPLSLVLFDIDGFKHYNDTYGHLEGDKILQKAGQIVTRNIRLNVDSGHRYGGDEFIIILPEADKTQAVFVAERICRSFLDRGLKGVTVSVGLVEYDDEYDLKTFIKHADEAMYSSKRAGGNRVSIFEKCALEDEFFLKNGGQRRGVR